MDIWYLYRLFHKKKLATNEMIDFDLIMSSPQYNYAYGRNLGFKNKKC